MLRHDRRAILRHFHLLPVFREASTTPNAGDRR